MDDSSLVGYKGKPRVCFDVMKGNRDFPPGIM